MATRQLNVYADIDSGRLITSASSTLQATLPRFTYRDTIPVSFRALTASGSPSAPWRDADLTGQSVRIAIGNPSARPLSGSFAMTYDGDTTTAIQWDASATDVASALNILDSVISAGGVSVSKQTNGIYRIAFLTVGAKEDFLTDSGPLVPSGSMITNRVVTGDATTKEIVALSFEALPAAYADLSDPLPSANVAITMIRAGSVSIGEIRTIEFPVIPFGGTYSLAVNGNSTTGLAWDASAEDIGLALQYLAGMAGNVTVTGAFPFFTVNFAMSVGELTSMTADPSGLVVPVGRMGTLSTATSEFLDMLAGSSLASAKFEIELHDIATDDTWTIIQADCQVARDIISESPVVPALRPTPRDWLETQLDDLGIGAGGVPVLIRSAAEGAPSNGDLTSVLVSGITYPAEANGTYVANGVKKWLHDTFEIKEDPYTPGRYQLSGTTGFKLQFFVTASLPDTPAGLSWSSGDAVGTGTVASSMVASAGTPGTINQWSRVGDEPGPFEWYRFDGFEWNLEGSGGAGGPVTAADISDSTAAGRALITAADAAAQRNLIIPDASLAIAKTIDLAAALTARAEFVLTAPTTGGTDGDYRVVAPTGVIYRKVSGTWTPYSGTTVPEVFFSAGIPSSGYGANGDMAVLYSGGSITGLATKAAGTWTQIATTPALNKRVSDRKVMELVDHFISGKSAAATNDVVGALNWRFTTMVGNTGSARQVGSLSGRFPGTLKLVAGNLSGDASSIAFGTGVDTTPAFSPNAFYENMAKMSLGWSFMADTEGDFYLGFTSNPTTTAAPTRFAGIRALKGTTNFQFCAGDGTFTVADSLVPVDALNHTFDLSFDSTTAEWLMSIDQAPAIRVAESIGRYSTINIGAWVKTNSVAYQPLYLNKFYLYLEAI